MRRLKCIVADDVTWDDSLVIQWLEGFSLNMIHFCIYGHLHNHSSHWEFLRFKSN